MSAIPVEKATLSEEEYLQDELTSDVKHELVAGVAHAMAGASYEHNTIAGNIFAALHSRLRGQPCQPFASDMKVRIADQEHVHFYYPDAMIVCDRSGLASGRQWTDKPVVIFEVVSESTRRIDEGEKALLYWKVPTLAAYILVEQDKVQVAVRLRDGGGHVLTGRHSELHILEPNLRVPVGEFYERLTL